jgi:hypothetical protein
MKTLKDLVELWSSMKSDDDPYGSVEDIAKESSHDLWPYAVIQDQIESAWSNDEYRGAIALNLARTYKPSLHGLAAFMTLYGKWPDANATTALNLLTLAHRCDLVLGTSLSRFIGRASVNCVLDGLQDSRALISEEATNVLGGMSAQQLSAVAPTALKRLRSLAVDALARVDDGELNKVLRDRVDLVLGDLAIASSAELTDVDARLLLKELEPFWSTLAPDAEHADIAASLRTFAVALVWRAAGGERNPIEVVYVYSATSAENDNHGWNIIQPWFDTVRGLVTEGSKPPRVAFETLDAMSGSLMVTLRIDAETMIEERLGKRLREANSDHSSEDDVFGEIYDLVKGRSLHVRVAHVQPDGTSASVLVTSSPDDPVTAQHYSKRLMTHEIPQANDLEKIFSLVARVSQDVTPSPSSIGVTTERQVQYYRAAARALSLLSVPGERLTRTGWLLAVATGEDKYRRLRAAFEASACGQAWLEWAGATKLGDIPADSGAHFLEARSELTGDTVTRRANTIDKWLAKLRQY